jgi:RNA polymerase sigma-70 factor (ECF subfamily)
LRALPHETKERMGMGLTFWLSAAVFAVRFSADAAFLRLLRNGDKRAIGELVQRHHPSLVRLANSIVKNRAVAEEVAQETWIAVITRLASFEGRSSFSTWIISILLNKAKDHLKREGRYTAMSDGADEGGDDAERALQRRFDQNGHWSEPPLSFESLTPERIVAGRELWQHARQMIDCLPPAQRAVMIMRDVEGMDPSDICRLLEITSENQRILLHRARTRIRSEMEMLMMQTTAGAAVTKA